MSPAILTIGLAGVLSWMLVGLVRAYALRRGVIDEPNARSSHTVRTPRGGGAGMVIAILIGLLAGRPEIGWRLAIALAAILPTAIVGWMDDHRSLPATPRLVAHVATAIGLLPLALQDAPTLLVACAFGAAWLVASVSAIEVVNFMDGIDGIIGLQAAIFGLHVALLARPSSTGGRLGLALLGGAIGFLVWNWPRAKIFLGDVGSGSAAVLGLIAGIETWRAGDWPFVAVFLPLLPIFLDASVTMARRVARGEQISEAHRNHLYQRLANDAGWRHAPVTLLFGVASLVATAVVWMTPREYIMAAAILYAATIFVVGWLLDRIAPFAPRVPAT